MILVERLRDTFCFLLAFGLRPFVAGIFVWALSIFTLRLYRFRSKNDPGIGFWTIFWIVFLIDLALAIADQITYKYNLLAGIPIVLAPFSGIMGGVGAWFAHGVYSRLAINTTKKLIVLVIIISGSTVFLFLQYPYFFPFIMHRFWVHIPS